MALNILPKKFHPDFSVPNKKPVGGVELDPSHPLSVKARICLLPKTGGQVRNLGNLTSFVPSGDIRATSKGLGADDLSNPDIDVTKTVTLPCTLVCQAVTHTAFASGTRNLFAYGDTTQNDYFGFRVRPTDVGFISALNFDLDVIDISTSLGNDAGSVITLVAIVRALDDKELFAFVNGEFIGSAASTDDQTAFVSALSQFDKLSVNRSVSHSTIAAYHFDTEIADPISFGRDLYQFLRPIDSTKYFTPEAAPPAGGDLLLTNRSIANFQGIRQ